MKIRNTWLILILVALMALWGCSDDDDDPVVGPDYLSFSEVAEIGAAYLNSTDCPGVMSAADLAPHLADYTIIDIRGENAYNAGHIEGAYVSTMATVLDDLDAGNIPNEPPFVVACFSGQSAGHAKIAMELAGYSPVFSLSFGMSGWNSSLSTPWLGQTVDDPNGGDNLLAPSTVNENVNLTEHDYPTLPMEVTSSAGLGAWILSNGFKAKSWEDVAGNLDDYFIINYWTMDQYMGENDYAYLPGHIPGAYQFSPRASLGMDQMLNNIDPDKPVLVYCWTSQTSSQVTAYLNMLGYEAYSLKFGANHLFYSSLQSHKFVPLTTDYPLTDPVQ
jgi:rhodanese-related sulfurtransferase